MNDDSRFKNGARAVQYVLRECVVSGHYIRGMRDQVYKRPSRGSKTRYGPISEQLCAICLGGNPIPNWHSNERVIIRKQGGARNRDSAFSGTNWRRTKRTCIYSARKLLTKCDHCRRGIGLHDNQSSNRDSKTKFG